MKEQTAVSGFDLLLYRLHADRNGAEENFDRDSAAELYLRTLNKLVDYFDGRKCSDPNERANIVLSRVQEKLTAEQSETFSDEKIKDVNRYIFGVARFVYLEVFREPEDVGDPIDDPSIFNKMSFIPPELIENDDPRLKHLEECRKKLPATESNLILDYYKGEKREKIENRGDLAAQYNLSPKTFKVKICRIRKRLGDCIKRKMAAEH